MTITLLDSTSCNHANKFHSPPFIKASQGPFWSHQLFCNYNNISIAALLATFIHIPRCVSFGSKTLP